MRETSTGASRPAMPVGPLTGVRVLEIGHYIAAPHCAMMLADQGADVVKVEPLGGEPGRKAPPFNKDGDSLAFACHNRGKRSIAIDLTQSDNKAALDALLRWADIVVTNYSYGIPEKLGFGFERLTEVNPRAVMVHITGYGTKGPRRDFGAFDPSIQAMSGFSDLTGAADGPPQISQFFLADHSAATHAAYAALCALTERDRTGKARKVEVSMLETMTSQLSYHIPTKGVLAGKPTRRSAPSPTGLPHVYQAKDAPVLIMLVTVPTWTRFCKLVGHPEWMGDGKKVPNLSETEGLLDEVKTFINNWFAERTSREAYTALQNADIVAGAFRSVSQLYDEEMQDNTGLIAFVELKPGTPPAPVPGPAFHMAERGEALPRVPRLGDNTYEILCEAGMTSEALQALGITENPPAGSPVATAQPAPT
ncbi:MAG TPA: CoA transferase [Rhizomicrobium sp.]|nr:CoA transferase [Rhizomicrobium sp.]